MLSVVSKRPSSGISSFSIRSSSRPVSSVPAPEPIFCWMLVILLARDKRDSDYCSLTREFAANSMAAIISLGSPRISDSTVSTRRVRTRCTKAAENQVWRSNGWAERFSLSVAVDTIKIVLSYYI